METRVIPNEVRDLPKGDRSHKLVRVLRAPWMRSLALLGMTEWFVWFFLPQQPLLEGLPLSQTASDRNGKLLRVALSTDQKFRIWTPLSKVSPDLINATLRYEDKYYSKHPGVNPVALARCAFNLVRFRHATAGGSTITMQLARLRFHLYT